MSRAVPILLAGWLAGCAACSRNPPHAGGAGPASAVLIVSADVRGYLGPCGCSENMRGGIARAAWQVDDARRAGAPVFFLDGGDSLFGHLHPSEAEIPQETRKARALAEVFKQMGVATRAVGALDEVGGPELLKGLGLPDQPNGTFRLLEARGHRIGVVAAATGAELMGASAKSREAGAEFVLGFLHQSLEQAQQVASQPGLKADLLVATYAPGEFSAEENRLVRTAVPVARLQSKGRSLLRVDLTFGDASERFELLKSRSETERELDLLDQRIALMDKQINAPGLREDAKALYRAKLTELVKRREGLASAPPPTVRGKNTFALRFIPLEASLPALPRAEAVVAAYDRDVAKLNLEWARAHGQDCPLPKKGEAAFVGSAACKECHAEAFPVWEGMKHSHAYESLVEKGKQYNLDCVQCHVTGYGKPGGVCRVDKVEGRAQVGCESCHGPGSLHVKSPDDENIVARPGQEVCVGCHNQENSPHFDFATYLPQILGKGHGARASHR